LVYVTNHIKIENMKAALSQKNRDMRKFFTLTTSHNCTYFRAVVSKSYDKNKYYRLNFRVIFITLIRSNQTYVTTNYRRYKRTPKYGSQCRFNSLAITCVRCWNAGVFCLCCLMKLTSVPVRAPVVDNLLSKTVA